MDLGNMDRSTILMLAIPIVIIQLGLQIYALVDLSRQPQARLKWFNKWVWVGIIILGELLGPIAYFVLARKEE